jgi:hypothetical protein
MISIVERMLNPQSFNRFYRGRNRPTPYGSQGRLSKSGSLAATSGVYRQRRLQKNQARKAVLSQYTNPMQNV